MKIKTGLEALDDVVQVLELANIKTDVGLTGNIRKIMRILNSVKEDIVVNCLTSGAEQVTETAFNINVHVPNLMSQPTNVPNAVDNTQPDVDRMKIIGVAVMNIFKDYRGFDFFTSLGTTGEVIPDGKGGFYYNIVIWYYYLQKNN